MYLRLIGFVFLVVETDHSDTAVVKSLEHRVNFKRSAGDVESTAQMGISSDVSARI